MKILDHLIKSLRGTAVFNPEVQVAPTCILWPDRDRQWEAGIPRLQAEMPELMVLGDYEPDKRTGPAIWLRCVMANTIDDVILPGDLTPIFYLPGVSRQDLRAVESCPDFLKPLAELQFRGVIWSQLNARDWTILAFLKSDQGGLGLDVAMDNGARYTMQLCLYRLLDEEVELLTDKRLDKNYFNTLLTSGDPVRELLQWLDQGDDFRAGREENEWKAFVEVCKSQLAFNPQKQGLLAAAGKLASGEGPWSAVWGRFCEAPKRYPHIPDRIRKCQPPNDNVFWNSSDSPYIGWPQWNDDQEKSLRQELMFIGNSPAHEARKKLLELEKKHAHRRRLVWAELGEAPTAMALEHLAVVADITKSELAAGTIHDMAAGYRNYGWRADDAVIRALEQVERFSDFEPVRNALRAVYLPWAETSARYLQKIWEDHAQVRVPNNEPTEDECIMFVDGLRMDCAKRLARMLEDIGLSVVENDHWAALPSVTGTGKPAAASLGKQTDMIAEEPEGFNFEILSTYYLRKALEENGFQVFGKKSVVEESSKKGKAWCEYGDIDHEGHDRGWKLAKHINAILLEIRDRITALMEAGWKTIRVVTDHGWLLMPGELPKIELPAALADTKWGRCASLKPGAKANERLYPWYWNPNRYFALADGISCYRNGLEFTHGGLSLQECLIPVLLVSGGKPVASPSSLEITDIVWKGLRCTVAVDGNFMGLSMDVRMQAGEASSSVVVGVKPLKESGAASVVVENEDMEGRESFLVLLDASGELLAQAATVIGGESK